jgi:hypothetical protein
MTVQEDLVDQGTRMTGGLSGSGNENDRTTWWIRGIRVIRRK